MEAAEKLLTKNLDVWTSAVKSKSSAGRGSNKKQELYGIAKLRELILELAVRGLLVPQNPDDEPASELLESIIKKNAQLTKVGALKKQRPQPTTRESDEPFTRPSGWEFARFGDVFTLEYGNNLPAPKRSETGEFPVYGSNGVVGTHKESCIDQPCIVVGRKGSAGALNLCLSDGCWVTDVAYSVVPPSPLCLEFVFLHFHTLGLDALGKGIKPGLSRKEAYRLVFCIPPLAEQRRIVDKVDELMALCDKLELEQESCLDTHDTLVATLLGTLTNSVADASRFAQAWQRIQDNFDVLFTTEDSIDQLKQTILHLAVLGKLASQDPDDEPAESTLNLLGKVRSELLGNGYPNPSEAKAQLRKQSKQKTPTNLEKLPCGWTWATLMQTSTILIDCHNKTAPYVPNGIPLIRTTNIRNGSLNFREPKFVTSEIYERWSARAYPEPGDILITREAPMGEACIIPEGVQLCMGQRIMLARVSPEYVDARYVLITIKSPDMMDRIQDKPVGATVKHLRVGGVESMLIPLPPLAEQRRIVAKVEELEALCDQLKGRVFEAQNTQLNLADSLVEQAVR